MNQSGQRHGRENGLQSNVGVIMGLKNFLIAAAVLCMAGSAGAAKPEPWQIMFQEPASPVMRMIEEFNITISIVIIMITILVLVLLVVVLVRFNEKANPVPSKTTHNTFIEVIWTSVPVIILVLISVPSFKLLYFEDRHPDPRNDPQGDWPPVVLDL